MSRYLITGATTAIGEAVIRALLAQEGTASILAVGVEAVRPTSVEIDGRVRYVRLDLTRERNLRHLMFGPVREHATEVVIDMASHRGVGASGPRARALNVLATRSLLALSEEHPTIRRFVYRGFGEVYAIDSSLPSRIDEAQPLDLSPGAPQWVRDRVEADLTVCTRFGMSPLSIAVVRAAECLAPRAGSQLHDYLSSDVCYRPLGYDPVINLVSIEDLGRALALAAGASAQGIFNIPGATTLPLSEIIRRSGRRQIPVPGPLMTPLYALRRAARGTDFDYAINRGRLHHGAVLDGARARTILGYAPEMPVPFPID
ncbi:MAG: NAD-dependent epimerase/dehydratase family protein [Sandaracinaceae bacterium]|nr:NAD-dependent epimerase/dehydratase family protein [Sandaracinaceae bacterium]